MSARGNIEEAITAASEVYGSMHDAWIRQRNDLGCEGAKSSHQQTCAHFPLSSFEALLSPH